MKTIRLLIISLILPILLIGLSSAAISSITGQFNKCVNLKQLCGNCTYNNITSIVYTDSSQQATQVSMTKTGIEYNYTTCNTTQLGTYNVNGVGDVDGVNTPWGYTLSITADGNPYQQFPSIYVVIILAILFLIFQTYLRRVFDSNIFSIFSGILFMVAGILTLYPGYNYINYSNLNGLTFGFMFIGIGGILLIKEVEGIF